MLGAKGFWTKSTMYDDAARVPLIAAGPGVAPGRWDAPVSLIDLAPTICAAVGAEAAGFPGRGLLDPDPARAVLSEYHDGGSPVGITMLRWTDATGAWKYVHYAEGQPPQLFELAADPDERTDLAARRPDVLAAARDRLFAMLDPEEVNARALAAQARRVEDLGGRDALEALPVFNYTPADSG
jgi:choline-sulfatase